MSSEQPSPEAEPAAPHPPQHTAGSPRRRRLWSAAEVWLLGAFSVVGIVGFVATFALLLMRAPNAAASRPVTAAEIPGPSGERGPPGPPGAPGPRGPAGESGLRLVRAECSVNGGCIAECAGDEVLLSAYCSPTRAPVTYPSEHSASCRGTARGRVEVVAACVKSPRR